MTGPSNVISMPGQRLRGNESRRALVELRDRARLAEVEVATIAKRLGELLGEEAADVR